MSVSRILTILTLGVLIIISMTTFWDLGRQSSGRTITVYGYSAMEEPLKNEVIPAFQEWYRQTHGEEVEFVTSFAGSGHLFNQIRAGAPAQVAIFATKDFSPRKMHGILTAIRMSTGFWHKQRGHPLTKEKSLTAQRALAQYLLDKLPRPVLPDL